jgi:DNA-binding NarL/FixJ family response regulator
MPETHHVVLADDHDILRKGMISVLGMDRGFRVIGEAGNGLALLNLLQQGTVPDLLILDLSMPLLSGVETLRLIRQKGYAFKILVLTLHKEPEFLCQSLRAGANGYMLKDVMADELLPALRDLLEDRLYLSPSMAKWLPDNCRMKAIADQNVFLSSVIHCDKNLIEPPW